jgi:hypothetical protein
MNINVNKQHFKKIYNKKIKKIKIIIKRTTKNEKPKKNNKKKPLK